MVVIEAIKLLEGNLRQVVDADLGGQFCRAETQMQRLMSERGYSEDLARQRIASQNKQEDKLRQADVIIENDGDMEETRKQVARHWAEL